MVSSLWHYRDTQDELSFYSDQKQKRVRHILDSFEAPVPRFVNEAGLMCGDCQYLPNIFSFESMFESIFESIFAKDFEPPGKPSLVLEPPPPALSMCFPPHRKPAQNSSDARKYYFYISLH